ncbi:branched-chain amino acid ABC transporter permease [Bradyrhizobium sp. SSBR45G]|uniref:branched-chain amino acid ABC transporter permease n=1 Tax=unclassified Bradyrhizobium TaxID=2631580 RepID=UPI0023429AE4|nr:MULTISPECIES: branched-chain amino acid ABC transporter permease [unclassified Bradyrhizobium]GLH76656.1 branched-chain amino acid ABC transporter permease [Bradyrhizobium sp. SSBR45G]GLH84269.1 branched-chain amino acid ABC transporter permease [Bradyrhizobium sp. SSBR45R]
MMSASDRLSHVLRTSIIAVAIAALALVVMWPMVGSLNSLRYLAELFVLIGLAQMWNLLSGYAGMATVGQHLFVGVGAYSFYGLAVLAGWPAPLALLCTPVLGAMSALPAFAMIVRLRTAYFAIGTWVLAESVKIIAAKLPGFGHGLGASLPVPVATAFGSSSATRLTAIFYLTFITATGLTLGMAVLMRSRIGLALRALRDQESAAHVFGINSRRLRPMIFAGVGAALALLGALTTLQRLRISPDTSFSLLDYTVNIIFIVIIGGIGSTAGPVIGAVIFIVLRESLANLGPIYLIILGLVAIAMMLFEPKGVVGLIDRLARLSLTIPFRRPILSSLSNRKRT